MYVYFGTRAYLFSPQEGSCYVFYTRNNCCKCLASYGVIIQRVIQSYLKTPCGASLSYINHKINNSNNNNDNKNILENQIFCKIY